MPGTIDAIRDRLAPLEPQDVHIVDESARHAGHAGARSGGGHYLLTVVSHKFMGQSALARHRMVYGLLREMLHGDIHALSVKAYTPEEI
nr:BolA family protein [Nitrosovibrio sp. Nv17]